jgi:hypothetical protein
MPSARRAQYSPPRFRPRRSVSPTMRLLGVFWSTNFVADGIIICLQVVYALWNPASRRRASFLLYVSSLFFALRASVCPCELTSVQRRCRHSGSGFLVCLLSALTTGFRSRFIFAFIRGDISCNALVTDRCSHAMPFIFSIQPQAVLTLRF